MWKRGANLLFASRTCHDSLNIPSLSYVSWEWIGVAFMVRVTQGECGCQGVQRLFSARATDRGRLIAPAHALKCLRKAAHFARCFSRFGGH